MAVGSPLGWYLSAFERLMDNVISCPHIKVLLVLKPKQLLKTEFNGQCTSAAETLWSGTETLTTSLYSNVLSGHNVAVVYAQQEKQQFLPLAWYGAGINVSMLSTY